MKIAEQLPRDLPAIVCMVLHIPPDSQSLLPQLLARRGAFEARHPKDKEKAKAGTIYIAPPDMHLLVEDGGMLRTIRGPRENRHRPAIDPLFRSAALAFGPRTIGVVLTGSLDDGTAGLLAVKQQGGIAIVQDPKDALYPSMPASAIANVEVDHVVPLSGIVQQIVSSASAPIGPRVVVRPEVTERMRMEKNVAEMDADTMQNDDRPGNPSAYSCPECGGVLWEIEEGELVRFRCRVGHAYSPESVLSAQDEVLEDALWSAMKTLEESARLSKRLAASERARGHDWMAKRFEEKEAEARERVEVIRRFLREPASLPTAEQRE